MIDAGDTTCPVCGQDCDGGVRTHLLVRHHKSDIARALIEAREGPAAEP